MNKAFWKPEDTKLSPRQKSSYKNELKKMELIFYANSTICYVTLYSIIFQTLFAKGTVWYRPSWMTSNQMKIYMMGGSHLQMLAIVAMDGLVIIFISVTYLQFKLLGNEAENLFFAESKYSNEEVKVKFKKFVEHHTFLMR